MNDVRFVGWKDAAGNIPYVEDRRAKVPVAARQTALQAERKRARQNRKKARSR